MLHNIIPGGIIAGPRIHGHHHITGKHNYQKFFTYFDRLIGTHQNGQYGNGKQYAVSSISKQLVE